MTVRRTFHLVAVGACLALGGCHQDAKHAPDTAASPPRVAADPRDELARLDARTPVPLQPMMAWHQKQNMMQHLVAIQRVTDGLAREDGAAGADAAASIGSSPQMTRMCQHMGAGAEGFTEMALAFHERADAIAEAAGARDAAAVLRATSDTLHACTACHARFRQEVVDPATWEARTGASHDPAARPAPH
jgi:hypothetical protein